MNETTYIYIVHSDINENNIYAEFKTEKEAIDYARRNSDELTYVDKVEVALDEAGDIIEMFDSETIWVYEDEVEEEPSETDDDYWDMLAEEDEAELSWSVCIVDLETSDSNWVNFDSEEEATNYYNEYCEKTNVSVQLYDPETMVDSRVIESLDTEALVEKMEENEDMVECKECFELFPKADGIKIELGYVCPHCHQVRGDSEVHFEPDFEVADSDVFKLDFPELEKFRDPDSEFANAEPNVPNAAPEEPSVEPACVGPECEAPVEAPVTKEETIATLVRDEHEAIDGYEKAKVEIEANPELDKKEKEEILDTIEHIKEEEIEHIEELDELVVSEEEVEEIEDIEKVEDENGSISDADEETVRVLTEAKWKVSKESFKEIMEGQEDLQVAFGDPREWGYIDRDWYAADLGDGRYELYAHDIDINDDVHEYVDSIEFDSFDEFWEYLTETLIADGDYYLEFDVVSGEELTEHVNEKLTDEEAADLIYKYFAELDSEEDTYLDTADEMSDEDLMKWLNEATIKEDIKTNRNTFLRSITKHPEMLETQKSFGKRLGLKVDSPELERYMTGVKSNRIKYTQLTDAVCDKFRPVLFNESLKEHVNEEHPAIESEQELVGTDNAVVDCKVNKVITHSEDEKPLNCEMKDKPLEKPLTEETHAQFAKPEGNRVQAYNNALKYAKQYNKEFIYGYTNHTGKFFALEQPIKVTGTARDAEKEFRNKYKNCGVVYMVYPDKSFLREASQLAEYWWEDNDPMNWSDFDPIVYNVTYKGELVGYVQFGYMGYETYPSKEEIEKLIISLLDEIDTIPEDYSMDDVDYEFGDCYDMNGDLPVLEEQLQETLKEDAESDKAARLASAEKLLAKLNRKSDDYVILPEYLLDNEDFRNIFTTPAVALKSPFVDKQFGIYIVERDLVNDIITQVNNLKKTDLKLI